MSMGQQQTSSGQPYQLAYLGQIPQGKLFFFKFSIIYSNFILKTPGATMEQQQPNTGPDSQVAVSGQCKFHKYFGHFVNQIIN